MGLSFFHGFLFCLFHMAISSYYGEQGGLHCLKADRKKTPVLGEVFSNLVPLRFRPSGSGSA